MRLGLGARLALVFAVLAAVIAFVTAMVASASTDRRINDDVDRFLLDRASDIAEGRRRAVEGSDRRSRNSEGATPVQSVLRAVEADALVQLLNRSGEPMLSTGALLPVSDADLEHTERFLPALFRTIELDNEAHRMVTMHFAGGGAVQVAQSIEDTNLLVNEIRGELLIAGVLLSGLAGLVGWFVASRTTRPLRRLTATVEDIRRSRDLTRPVSLDRDDELGRLSDAFDDLLQTLSESRQQQQRLVQDAAHELRTPLTSVRANIAFLERAPDLDEPVRQSTLNSIKSELTELSDLLAEVVELATESRDETSFERIDLATTTEAALAQFELRSSRPVERDIKTSWVRGDHAMLTRAVANLIGNADKYTPDNTAAVSVTVSEGVVCVADRGPGIAPGDRDKIFERFWRDDQARSVSGSGLGLAIVKKTVDEHAGTVFVRDRSGGGTEVGFTLPIVPEPSESQRQS